MIAIVAWVMYRPKMSHHNRVKIATIALPKRGDQHDVWRRVNDVLTEERAKLVSEGFEILSFRIGKEPVLEEEA